MFNRNVADHLRLQALCIPGTVVDTGGDRRQSAGNSICHETLIFVSATKSFCFFCRHVVKAVRDFHPIARYLVWCSFLPTLILLSSAWKPPESSLFVVCFDSKPIFPIKGSLNIST